MILKAINYNRPDRSVSPETIFVDGFVNMVLVGMRLDEALREDKIVDIAVNRYYNPEESNPECRRIIKITTKKEDDTIVKVLYFDDKYSIYLLNDEGKTIERIN